MGKVCLDKIEFFHMVEMPKSERLKVNALNLRKTNNSPLTGRFQASRPSDRLSLLFK